MDDIYFMKCAMNEALKAFKIGDVPIGCVIVKDNKIISTGFNKKEKKGIATYHAEIIAINRACQKLGTWHLEDCTLYTTMEPCMMCTGAIMQARISKVVYGVSNKDFGYISKTNNKIITLSGVLENESSKLLNNFFSLVRKNNN